MAAKNISCRPTRKTKNDYEKLNRNKTIQLTTNLIAAKTRHCIGKKARIQTRR